MAIWQNSNGGLHDDMGGEALSLPAWPQGMARITDALAAAIQAQQAAAQQDARAARPNPAAFGQAIKAGLGGIQGANALSVAYPLFFGAIQSYAWDDVQAMLADAKAKAFITSAQYAEIKAAAAQCNIPIAL